MRVSSSGRRLLLLALLCGCGGSEPKPVAAVPKDEWDSIPSTPEWLHATKGFSGDRTAECTHVLDWARGEASCTGSLCDHGLALAQEWSARCSKLLPDEAEEVAELRVTLKRGARDKGSECTSELAAMTRDGCGEDATCRATAQAWATRCGEKATPLAVRILESRIERRSQPPEPITLDLRSCEVLRAEMARAGLCTTMSACDAAREKVETLRARCEAGGERPTLETAAIELAILSGAQQPAPPIGIRKGLAVASAELPLVLADGSGAVLTVCGERIVDASRYLAARRACKGGVIAIARAFRTPSGFEARLGMVDAPDDATFAQRYPSLSTSAEADLRASEALPALEASLDAAASLSSSNAAEAARELAKTLVAHAPLLWRSASLRAAVTKRDAALVSAMRELGKAKAKTRGPAPSLAAMARRALEHAFADVGPDGAVAIAASSHAARLDTAALLPTATLAYLEALRPLTNKKPPAPNAAAVRKARAEAEAHALACGEAQTKFRQAETGLIRCAFGLDECPPEKQAELAQAADASRAAAEAARSAYELALDGPAGLEKDAIGEVADKAACREPWW